MNVSELTHETAGAVGRGAVRPRGCWAPEPAATARRSAWRRLSGTSIGAGRGLSPGTSKGVPSGMTPAARRSANLLCCARSRSISRCRKSPRIGRGVPDARFDEMLEIAVGLLQVLGPEKQPFEPGDLAIPRHRSLSCLAGGRRRPSAGLIKWDRDQCRGRMHSAKYRMKSSRSPPSRPPVFAFQRCS